MKNLVFFVCLVALGVSNAQEPFQENGKWGLSKYGDTSEVIFPADYDKILTYYSSEGMFYAGLKEKMLHPLTSNEQINEMQYDRIEEDPSLRSVIFCFRDGELDIISTTDYNFLIKDVKADKISIEMENAYYDNEYLITIETADGYGLVDMDLGKVILKAEYDNIQANWADEDYIIITKDKKKGVVGLKGEVVIEPTNMEFERITPIDTLDGCFLLEDKKYNVGFYDSKSTIYIPPVYFELAVLQSNSDLIVVVNKKGTGLYYKGQLVVDCKYDDIMRSDQKDYIAYVLQEGGDFYVKEDGELIPAKTVNPNL